MTLLEKINIAYETKELFFKPWVGDQYEDGLQLKGDEKRRKVLIIGASRYCIRCIGKDKDSCLDRKRCLWVINYDKLRCVNSSCSVVEGRLCDINTYSIYNHIKGENPEVSYQRFEEGFLDYSDCMSNMELWNHVSFINYLQCCIDTIATPARSSSKRNTGLYDASKVIVEKIVSLLCPDLIILWGNTTFQKNMNIVSKKESSCSRLFYDCKKVKNWIYEISIGDSTYPLILTRYHPSFASDFLEGKDIDDLVKYLRCDSPG